MINELTIVIWGREFKLPIEYDCYEGENVTRKQTKALKRFIKDTIRIEQAKKVVEEYCADEVNKDTENTKKDSIFSYVIPQYILVKRDKENPRVAIMCKYRYDLEHGLAIIFSSDEFVSIGIQDIIL